MTRIVNNAIVVAADVFTFALDDEVQFVFAAIDQLFRLLQTQILETRVIDLWSVRQQAKEDPMFTQALSKRQLCSDYRDDS